MLRILRNIARYIKLLKVSYYNNKENRIYYKFATILFYLSDSLSILLKFYQKYRMKINR